MDIEEAMRWVNKNCYDESVLQRLRSRRVAKVLFEEVERLREALKLATIALDGKIIDRLP